MTLRPFEAMDILDIVPQASQALETEARERILNGPAKQGPCWTYEGRDGRIVAVGGLVFIHDAWATAWTVLAQDIGAAMVGLTRAVADVLRAQADKMDEWGCIDMQVDPSRVESVRWAMLLGFRQEAWLDRRIPQGKPMTIWLYQGDRDGPG